MNTTNKYKKEILKLFYLSIDKEIDKWTASYNGFYGPTYNNYYITINTEKNEMYLNTVNENYYEKICKYRLFLIPINFKVWLYVIKLRNDFKRRKNDRINNEKIKYLKTGVEEIQKSFIKEIRKEKLNEIEKS